MTPQNKCGSALRTLLALPVIIVLAALFSFTRTSEAVETMEVKKQKNAAAPTDSVPDSPLGATLKIKPQTKTSRRSSTSGGACQDEASGRFRIRRNAIITAHPANFPAVSGFDPKPDGFLIYPKKSYL